MPACVEAEWTPDSRLRTVSVNCFSMVICLMSIRRYLPKRMIVACSVEVRIRGTVIMHEINSALRDDESNASSLNALRACHQGERESDAHPVPLLLNGQPIIHIT